MHAIKVLLLAGFILMPFSYAKACNVRPYALSYINEIDKTLGGTKPKLVIESGKDENVAAFYDGKAIHIYKGDYRGACVDETPYLKSVISHEYAHHIAAKLRPFTSLRGERLAYLAEHAIGDVIFGDNIEYDNDRDLEYPKDYLILKNFVLAKQSKNILTRNNTATLYFKNRQ